MKQETPSAHSSAAEMLKSYGGSFMSPEMERRSALLRQKSWFKEKYLKAQRTVTLMKMDSLLQECPGCEFKDLLAAILQEYPDTAS